MSPVAMNHPRQNHLRVRATRACRSSHSPLHVVRLGRMALPQEGQCLCWMSVAAGIPGSGGRGAVK